MILRVCGNPAVARESDVCARPFPFMNFIDGMETRLTRLPQTRQKLNDSYREPQL